MKMRKLPRILPAFAVLGLVGFLAFGLVPMHRSAPAQMLAAHWRPAAGQGKYVAIAIAIASDCIARLAAPGGSPLPVVGPLPIRGA